MKYCLNRQVDIHDLRKLRFHERQKYAFCGLSEIRVFHWRYSHNGCMVYRILAVRYAGYVENWKFICKRVITCMVPEWAFSPLLISINVTFQYYLGIRGNVEINSFAFNKLNILLSQEPCEHDLINIIWQGRCRRIYNSRVCADGYGDLYLALFITIIPCPAFVDMPVHAC